MKCAAGIPAGETAAGVAAVGVTVAGAAAAADGSDNQIISGAAHKGRSLLFGCAPVRRHPETAAACEAKPKFVFMLQNKIYQKNVAIMEN